MGDYGRSSVEDINVGPISKLIGIVVLVIFVITAF
jgi:hypothetical protein